MEKLRTAIRKSDSKQFASLLEEGISIRDLDKLGSDGLSLVHLAAEQATKDFLQALHDNGANLDQTTKEGQTALHIASRLGNLEAAKFLTSTGVNQKVADTNGNTPLHIAVENLRLEVAKHLCAEGASLDVFNKDGDAPVHIAASKADGSACISALAKAGANIDIKNSRTGETALFVAAANGHLEVVKTLLKLDANHSVRNAKGESAIDAARKNGHDGVVAALKESGAVDQPSQPATAPAEKPAPAATAAPAATTTKQPVAAQPPASQTAPSSASGVPSPELASMQRELEELRAQKAAFEAAKKELEELRAQKKKLEENTRSIVTLKTDNANLQQKVKTLTSESQQLTAKNTRLNDEVQSTRERAAKTETELAAAKRRFEKQLEDAKREHLAKIAKLNKQIEELKAAAAAAAAAAAEDNDVVTLRADNTRYKQAILELRARVTQLQAVVDQPNFIPYGQFGW